MASLELMTSTYEELNEIPIPKETDSYMPVSHTDLIDAILEETYRKDFILIRSGYKIAKEGNLISGKLIFTGEDPEIDMQIGLINSYDKSRPVKIGLGAEVFICLNGVMCSEMTSVRKHTTFVWRDIKKMIINGVERLYDNYSNVLKIKDVFIDREVSKSDQASLLGELFVTEDIITPVMANIIKREILESDLFPNDNLWSFYNHVTHALKKSHPSEYIDKHVKFHNFMKKL